MARAFDTGVITHEAVNMDDVFVAETIAKMRHLQVVYALKEAVEPRVARRRGDKKKVMGLHSDAYIVTAADLRTPDHKGGMMGDDEDHNDFVRLICLKDKTRKKGDRRGFIVDASHMQLGNDSLIDQRFDTDKWDYGMDGNPLRVIDFIGNSLDLGQLELSLAEQYDFVLPKSELWLIKEEQASV